MLRRRTLGLGLLILLQGCAYQQAMKRGQTAAAAQDWEQAYHAYLFANEIKPGRAEAALAQARTEGAAAELSAAERAIESKAFAKAAAHLERAEDLHPEHPGIGPVQEVAREAMLAELQARAASGGELREVYAFGIQAKRLYPDAPEVEDLTRSLRERLLDEVQTLVEAGEFAEARSLAEVIAEVEPEQATLGRAQAQGVTDVWVAHLVAQADRSRRWHPGQSAVYAMRAYEVGGDEAHRDAALAALQAAAPSAQFKLYVDTRGEGARHWRVRKAVREGAEALPGVTRGWASAWDLQAVVGAPAERCVESREETPKEKEYVSGTRQVPNPAFAEVESNLSEASAALEEATATTAAAEEQLARLEAEVEALTEALGLAQGAESQAASAAEGTREQLAQARAREAELRGELEALRTEGAGAGVIRDAEMKVEVIEGLVAEWVDKVAADEASLQEAAQVAQAAQEALAPVADQLDGQREVTAAAQAQRSGAEERVAALKKTRGETDETLTEDVLETLKYVETEWTWTCEARATIWFASRWKSGLERRVDLRAESSTTDLARPGHELAEIEEDPKAYPRSRQELVAEVDERSHQGIIEAIEAKLAEGYALKVSEALQDPDDLALATHTLLAVLAAAPERLDQGARDQLAAHLSAHYGLEDPALLGVVPLPEAPEADAPPAEAAAPEGERAEDAAQVEG